MQCGKRMICDGFPFIWLGAGGELLTFWLLLYSCSSGQLAVTVARLLRWQEYQVSVAAVGNLFVIGMETEKAHPIPKLFSRRHQSRNLERASMTSAAFAERPQILAQPSRQSLDAMKALELSSAFTVNFGNL